jgi:predicted O-methyltransferase YrrM
MRMTMTRTALLGARAAREDRPDVVAVAADPVVSARLIGTARIVNPGGLAEFGAAIGAQTAQVAAIAKALGIQ